MKLEHTFEVDATPQAAMALLLDAERVVPCMPGARLVEVVDDHTWKAAMTVKLGPVSMDFVNDVRLLEKDEGAGTVKLGISGRDTRGKGGAEATVDSRLVARDGGGTTVEMSTDMRFSGQAAQLGRPGVVKDVSNRMVDQFAQCIQAQLTATPEEAAAATERAQKPVSGISLMLAAVAGWFRRTFRIGGREKGGTA